jgi:hypothetical protein
VALAGGWQVVASQYAYPRVMRTTAELEAFEVARYADPNRIKP